MKIQRTLALIGALGLLAGSPALAQPAGDNESTPPRPAQDRAARNRPDPEMRRKALLEKYDANKDGKLDDAEHAVIGKDVEAGKFLPLRQGRPGFGPGPGPRGPREAGGPGFGPRHQELLDKYDANKDGKLDETEREAVRKDIASGKLERPHRGPGPHRGFGPPPGPENPDDQPALETPEI